MRPKVAVLPKPTFRRGILNEVLRGDFRGKFGDEMIMIVVHNHEEHGIRWVYSGT